MTMTTISKWGNSFAIRIPKAMMENVRFREGDKLEMNVTDDGELWLRPARGRLSLQPLLDGITPDNCPAEVEWGQARGKESW